ncbi:hypothetical protein AMAG_14447 [Allomyces macrogynus ATCC 38327]|uniref:Pre-mRNA-splicing factor SPF27 n=1 Tax=Allomyces macrogynus (strain ATCC 38327) TaxID=578462 RepID=A0A0L0T6U2_ALLM3|nr:hypothetical protein AMAG_14447 [Allomyces macrogynus ATCC 38327]|eukprot:KNE70299.1 hypothetical protein AMAG_14447 [Allomyces macrogynus ATCC 38327]
MSSDALPYVDTQYTIPEVKTLVDQMIDAELRTMRTNAPHDRVASIPPISLFSERPALQDALARTSQSEPTDGIDLDAYNLVEFDDPSNVPPEEWLAAVQRASTLLQHQATRLENLELLGVYGSNAWLYHLHQMEAAVKAAEGALARAQAAVTRVNRERKTEQTEALDKLQRAHLQLLETRTSNLQTLLAVAQLEHALEAKRRQAEEAAA